MTPTELAELERHLGPEERQELYALLDADLAERPWVPQPGPQTLAYESEADVIGFGGAAGGGKTDLAIGKAITQHQVAQFFRREGTELNAIIDRMAEIVGHRDGLGGKPPVWRAPVGRCKLIEFCSVPNLGDERKFQGRAKDLLVVDEATNFLESQVRFLMGWVRSVDPEQRTQTLLTFNPPTSAEGRWVIRFFAPWLDPAWKGKRAMPGELRYVAVIAGRDVWVEDGRPFVLVDELPVYDFDPAQYAQTAIIRPQSRTFIPSRITDNAYLVGTGYMSQLQALPEPLRSQMLNGDFMAGVQDDPWQVIPTKWIAIAQARWVERSPRGEMLSMGVDVARGGKDNTTIATRHKTEHTEHWYDKLKLHPGKETPDGNATAGLVIAERRDMAPIHIDVIGVGASPYDVLNSSGQDVYGINVSERAQGLDKSGRLTFFNLRSELWWRMREVLDPAADNGIAIPPDEDLAAELAAPRWELQGMSIKVESREDIVKRIGRSPDRATAVVLANIDTPKLREIREPSRARHVFELYGSIHAAQPEDYDPYRSI